jgi:hypothetical protein
VVFVGWLRAWAADRYSEQVPDERGYASWRLAAEFDGPWFLTHGDDHDDQCDQDQRHCGRRENQGGHQ